MEKIVSILSSTNSLKLSHELLDYLFENDFVFPQKIDKRRFNDVVIHDVVVHFFKTTPVDVSRKVFLSNFAEGLFGEEELSEDEMISQTLWSEHQAGNNLTQWMLDNSVFDVPLEIVKPSKTMFPTSILKGLKAEHNKRVKNKQSFGDFEPTLEAKLNGFARMVCFFIYVFIISVVSSNPFMYSGILNSQLRTSSSLNIQWRRRMKSAASLSVLLLFVPKRQK